MVKCSLCKYGHRVKLITQYDEILDEYYHCMAMDELIGIKAALDDLPCEFYGEELDDNETEKSGA